MPSGAARAECRTTRALITAPRERAVMSRLAWMLARWPWPKRERLPEVMRPDRDTPLGRLERPLDAATEALVFALFLIERRDALAMADQGELTPQLLAKLAPEWASLPTLQAKSYYGQPVKKHQDLKAFYEKSLEQERRQTRERVVSRQAGRVH